MFNGCAWRLLKVATAFGCDPYLVGASSGWVPNTPRRRILVSPRNLLSGVSLPGSGIGGVGVDERVEGAPKRPTWFVLLDVDQVEQAAQICSLVEPHGGVASFDDPNQASNEVEAVRTVIPLAVSSVNLHSHWLVHAFSPRREGPVGTEGGKPRPNLAITETLTPRVSEAVKRRRTLR